MNEFFNFDDAEMLAELAEQLRAAEEANRILQRACEAYTYIIDQRNKEIATLTEQLNQAREQANTAAEQGAKLAEQGARLTEQNNRITALFEQYIKAHPMR